MFIFNRLGQIQGGVWCVSVFGIVLYVWGKNLFWNRPGINPGRIKTKRKTNSLSFFFDGRLRGDGTGAHNKKMFQLRTKTHVFFSVFSFPNRRNG